MEFQKDRCFVDLTERDFQEVLEDAKALKKALEKFKESYCKYESTETEREELMELVGPVLCRVTKILIPNVQRKLDEIIVASENAEAGFKVCSSERGADIIDKDENRYEIKVSVASKSTGYKTNFNWPVPCIKGDPVGSKRKLLRQVREKTGGEKGGAIFQAVDHKRNALNEYRISGRFLSAFFENLNLKEGTSNYNFGCTRCCKCKEYHRLLRMVQMDRDGLYPTDSNCKVYDKISSNC